MSTAFDTLASTQSVKERTRTAVAAKQGRRITVCILDADSTDAAGHLVETIHEDLVRGESLVDEVLLMTRESDRRMAAGTRDSQTRVLTGRHVAPDCGPVLGKGDLMWRSVLASTGDIIVWLDGDLLLFTASHVVDLVAPLLADDDTVMVRGVQTSYERGAHATCGRVTELIARPALDLLFPHLAHIRQPLGGEQAVRREAISQLAVDVDEGASVGLLIDVAHRWGPGSIRQVDLGARAHRGSTLQAGAEQAEQVLRAIIARSSVHGVAARPLQRRAAVTRWASLDSRVA